MHWPWPSKKRNWDAAVLAAVVKAGNPRFNVPVDVVINAHPPARGGEVPSDLRTRVRRLVVDTAVAPVVNRVRLVERAWVRTGVVTVTLTEAVDYNVEIETPW